MGGGGTPSNGGPMTIADLTPTIAEFITSPGFWFGLAMAAVFLAAAARLRRCRGPL
jgi:hypothetical protein